MGALQLSQIMSEHQPSACQGGPPLNQQPSQPSQLSNPAAEPDRTWQWAPAEAQVIPWRRKTGEERESGKSARRRRWEEHTPGRRRAAPLPPPAPVCWQAPTPRLSGRSQRSTAPAPTPQPKPSLPTYPSQLGGREASTLRHHTPPLAWVSAHKGVCAPQDSDPDPGLLTLRGAAASGASRGPQVPTFP